ncbi:MAG: flagellar assembly protein FliW [Campylobacterota bacterium]|nr:flagellar assembly protein FliW [Campylobacterota bacterium]
MKYVVKSELLGFEGITEVELSSVDDLFSTLHGINDGVKTAFTLVNPYILREYSFDVPSSIKALLDIKEDSNIRVYNIAVLKNPIDESLVNFLAPIVFNEDNNTMAQVVLDVRRHVDFGFAEPLKDFRVAS